MSSAELTRSLKIFCDADPALKFGDVFSAICRGVQALPAALQVQNHHCPSTCGHAYPQLCWTPGKCAYTNQSHEFSAGKFHSSTTAQVDPPHQAQAPLTSQAPFIQSMTILMSPRISKRRCSPGHQATFQGSLSCRGLFSRSTRASHTRILRWW